MKREKEREQNINREGRRKDATNEGRKRERERKCETNEKEKDMEKDGKKKREEGTRRRGEGLKGDKGRGKGRVSTLRSKKNSIDISYTVAERMQARNSRRVSERVTCRAGSRARQAFCFSKRESSPVRETTTASTRHAPYGVVCCSQTSREDSRRETGERSNLHATRCTETCSTR